MKKISFLLLVTSFILFSCQKRIEDAQANIEASTLRSTDFSLQLVPFSTGYTKPIEVTNAKDSRLFIAGQEGRIWSCDSLGNKHFRIFLDITSKVKSTEFAGLLGFCFDPRYKQNGYFYVYYVDTSDAVVVERYKVSASDSNQANRSSALEIIRFNYSRNASHYGGLLKFGTDGYLYIGTGDNNTNGTTSQNTKTLLGKILRIDVTNSNASDPYDIPLDNPFNGVTGYSPQIYALGLREPWRGSYDHEFGLIVGDVGESEREEIDVILPGRNYGWPCYEGREPYNTTNCNDEYAWPIHTYSHASGGCSITGGYVYRGAYTPARGNYIFADYCSGEFRALVMKGNGDVVPRTVYQGNPFTYVSFGTDRNKELYVVSYADNTIYRLVAVD